MPATSSNYASSIHIFEACRSRKSHDMLMDIAVRKAREASAATANRYLALVRAILRKAAHEWEWIDRVPKVRMFKEAKRRVRWLTREGAATLIHELPDHQAEMVRFALATGLQQSNDTRLEWSQIDMHPASGVTVERADMHQGDTRWTPWDVVDALYARLFQCRQRISDHDSRSNPLSARITFALN